MSAISGPSRRRFMGQASMAAAGFASSSWLARALNAQTTSARSRLIVDASRQVSQLDHNLFGSFLEHLGRAIYGGVYDPGSSLADSNGFRKDVMEQIHKIGVPIIRYPGGNFVSGYHWLDGVGPKEDRPRVLDLAWNSIETNQFGTNEFITWCRAVGTEPLLATNLGTGTPEMAAALVEYCNVEGGTRWSDLRRKHGYAHPHGVKYWCLGNEMDGPWQIGHVPAEEYGVKARDAAHQMRAVDPSVKLVVCGSSGPAMPTYLEWDRQTLEQCYDEVDFISLHRYFGNDRETGGETSKYLAMNLSMDRQIEEITAVCDMVRGHKRSPKTLSLSFDEWNVWYRARGPQHDNGHRQAAPHLLEEVYNLEDALVVGGLLNTLIRRSDRVRVACLAQLVNVIAPIMTNENGLFLQTIYYPYAWALEHARGSALDLVPETATYDVPNLGTVPYLDIAGTYDAAGGAVALMILNRDLEKSRELEVVWHDLSPSRVIASQILTGDDLKASNSFESPRRVTPQPFDCPRPGARMTFELPARSYTMLSLAT